MNSNKKPEPRWERRKDARPHELVEAALELFVEKGFAATRLEDVAARAGVSKGTLYLYFDNKEALFKAVVQEGIVPVIEEGEALLQQYQGPAAELLRIVVHRWWETVGASQLAGVIKLIFSEAQNFPEVAQYYYDNVVLRGKRIFAIVVELGIRQGEFRALPVDHCVRLLLAPLLMLAIWRYSLGVCEIEPVDADGYLATYLDLAIGGLQTRGAA
jgi:AcrR family transcriptional regulator